MSAVKDTHGTTDHGADHGDLKTYLIGFVLAVILTAVPFGLVMVGTFTPAVTAVIVLGIAAVQMVVHLIYFLHMSPKSEGGWNMMALLFTVIILAIVLIGSVWIMHHLDTNMMPMQMTPEAARNLP